MSSQTRPYIALSLTCIIWGTTYLVNKLGVQLIPPFLFAFIRHSFAGILMLSYMFLIQKEEWPDWKYLRLQIFLGFLLLSIGNGVGVIGLKYIDSGLSAILAATSPILIAMLTHFFTPSDKIGLFAWIGLIIGFSGLSLICLEKIKFPIHLDENFIGISLTLLSIAAWASGTVISKSKPSKRSPFLSAGFQMIFASIPLGIVTIATEDYSNFHLSWKVLMIWAYLIVLGSLVAYTAYIYALKFLPAPVVSIQSYINPIIAMQLGYFILKENFSKTLLLGSALTLLGVFVVNYSEQKRKIRIQKLAD